MLIKDFEGRDWPDVDLEKIEVDEWRELKRKYRMTPKTFQEGIGEADPDASTFFYWLMLRRAGQHLAVLGDQLKPDIIALNKAVAVASEEEEAEEAIRQQAELEEQLEAAAQAEALRAAAGPTSPAGPPSPAPPSPTATTRPAWIAAPDQDTPSTSGSGTATSNGSAPSTSSPSPASASSATATSEGSA